MSIIIQANAKINLNFNILKTRTDGYHEIDSIVQSIDLPDFLFFSKNKQTQITGAIVCPNNQNIILKAQKLLERMVNKKLPCKIHLVKSIPISAGLGGGSADAAATLTALNLLYNLKFSKNKLAKIGVKIGADIPFFLYGGTCRVGGIGEKVTTTKVKVPNFFVLFRPHKRIETKMMYELYDKTGNNFLEICKTICPDIEKLEKYFDKFNLRLYLSGSGPTVFCKTNNYRLAKIIAEGYKDFNGDIFICQPQKEALRIWKE